MRAVLLEEIHASSRAGEKAISDEDLRAGDDPTPVSAFVVPNEVTNNVEHPLPAEKNSEHSTGGEPTKKKENTSARNSKKDRPYTGGPIRTKRELDLCRPSDILHSGMAVESKDVVRRLAAEYAERVKRRHKVTSGRCRMFVPLCAASHCC